MAKKERKPLFERLRTGLEESLAFTKGELKLKVVEIPDEPPEFDSEVLTALREQTKMSQAVFARMLNVSPKTVQSWEQRRRKPSMASKRLIQVFSQRPEVLCQIVGVPAIKLYGVKVIATANGKRKVVVQR